MITLQSFNGHPPLGVNATGSVKAPSAPTLRVSTGTHPWGRMLRDGAPCGRAAARAGFNGHPPLGVNATDLAALFVARALKRFQRAPTLGGECYTEHRPFPLWTTSVSTGTHPWG